METTGLRYTQVFRLKVTDVTTRHPADLMFLVPLGPLSGVTGPAGRSKIHTRKQGLEDIVDWLNERDGTPGVARIEHLHWNILQIERIAKENQERVKSLGGRSKIQGKPAEEREVFWRINTETRAHRHEIIRIFQSYTYRLQLNDSIHPDPERRVPTRWWTGFNAQPLPAEKPLYKQIVFAHNEINENGPVYEVHESDVALLVAGLANFGYASHLKRCEVCRKWFFARNGNAKRCSQECTDKKIFNDPDFKKSRAEYMREYRKGKRRRPIIRRHRARPIPPGIDPHSYEALAFQAFPPWKEERKRSKKGAKSKANKNKRRG